MSIRLYGQSGFDLRFVIAHTNVTRFGDLLDFGQLLNAFGNT